MASFLPFDVLFTPLLSLLKALLFWQASTHLLQTPARHVYGRQGLAQARLVAARAAANEAAERVPATGVGPGLFSVCIYIPVLVAAPHSACLEQASYIPLCTGSGWDIIIMLHDGACPLCEREVSAALAALQYIYTMPHT